MATSKGTIIYGDMSLLPGFSTASSGFGNLIVSGASLLQGASTTISGTLTADGASTLNSTLTVGGLSTFNAASSFVGLSTFSGGALISSTTDSTSSTTGALRVQGGLGVALSTYLGGIIDVGGAATLRSTLAVTSTSTFSGAVNITSATASTSATTGALTITGGMGIGGNFNAGGTIYQAGVPVVTTATLPTAGTGLTLTDNVFSVNATLTHVTAVGTLTGLTSSGIVTVTDISDSTSAITGSIQTSGGIGVAKNVFIGGSAINATAPTNGDHLTNKTYVDSLIVTAGTGLTKVGTALNVNAAQPQITSVGTLTGLTSSGIVNITNATESTISTNGALTVAGGVGIAKNLYVGGSVLHSAGYLEINRPDANLTFPHTWHMAMQVAGVQAWTLGTMNAAGSTSDFILQRYNDLGAALDNALIVRRSDAAFILSSATDSTSATTGSIQTAGGIGVAKSIFVGGSVINATAPTAGDHLTNKTYVDSVIVTAGTGLTKVGTALNVNAAQPQITSVGTLTGLTSSGVVNITNTTASTSTTSGALQVAGGVGVAGDIFIGGFATQTGAPTIGNHLTNKTYVDSVIVTAGTGLTKVGTALNVNASQPQITSVGTLTGLTSSGIINITNTTESTSTTTGALTVAGGVGIAKNLYVGGSVLHSAGYLEINRPDANLTFPHTWHMAMQVAGVQAWALGTMNASGSTSDFMLQRYNDTGVALDNALIVRRSDGAFIFSSATESTSATTGSLHTAGGIGVAKNVFVGGSVINATAPTAGDHLTNKTYVDSINVTAGTGLTKVGTALNVNAAQPQITSVGTLTGLTSSGPVVISDVTESTSPTTGALQVAGGVGIQKRLVVGSNIAVGNQGIQFRTDIIGGADYTISYNNAGDDLHVHVSGSDDQFTHRLYQFGHYTGGIYTTWNPKFSINTYNGNLNTMGTIIVNSAADSTSATTGSIYTPGGIGVAKNVFIGGSAINATAPTAGDHLTNKTYVDSLVVTAGTGLTKVGTALNVNAAQPQITSVGTLTGLTSSGPVIISDATDSTSPITGALQVAGGAGIAKTLTVGANMNVQNALTTSGYIGTFMQASLAAASYTGIRIGAAATVYDSLVLGFMNAGTGLTTNNMYFGLANAPKARIDGAGDLTIESTTESAGTGSGSLKVGGGIGVAKSINAGGTITQSSSLDAGYWLSVKNNSAGANALSVLGVFNDSTMATVLFLNSSTRAADGGPNAATLRNDVGALRLMSNSGGNGITIAATTGNVAVSAALTVGTTSLFTGAVTASSNVTAAGVLSVTNVTNSTAVGNGSIITSGGVGVALSMHVGENITAGGNLTLTGNISAGGTVAFTNTLDSTAPTNGALVVSGGAGIVKNLNVGGSFIVSGNATVTGTLYVGGTRTEVSADVVSVSDNVILVNAGPSGSATSGYAMKRYQYANDAGAGDIVNNDTPEHTGTAQAGSTATTIVLDPSADATDGWYDGAWVLITGGTGVDQVRRINTYAGATRTATLYTSADQATLAPTPVEGLDWTTTPDATSTYQVFTSQYVLTVFDETNNEYALGTTAVNPLMDPNVTIRNRLKMRAGSLRLTDRLYADNIENYTAGAGTTVEGVLLKDGTIAGVTTVNGNAVDSTGTVTLVDNNLAATAAIPGTTNFGAYTILVKAEANDGTSATFLLSGNNANGGSVFRATSVLGTAGEHLTIVWTPGAAPRLKFMNLPSNASGATLAYRVKVMTV